MFFVNDSTYVEIKYFAFMFAPKQFHPSRFDLRDGKSVHLGGSELVGQYALSDDKAILATRTKSGCRVWRLDTGELLLDIKGHSSSRLKVNGLQVDFAKKTIQHPPQAPKDADMREKSSVRGEQYLLRTEETSVRIFKQLTVLDQQTGEALLRVPQTGSWRLSPDGNMLAVSQPAGVAVYDLPQLAKEEK